MEFDLRAPGRSPVPVHVAHSQTTWFGCPVRNLWVRVLQASNGQVLGDHSTGMGGLGVLEGLAVNSEGRLLAALPVKSCGASDYTGAYLLTAAGTNPLDSLLIDIPRVSRSGLPGGRDQWSDLPVERHRQCGLGSVRRPFGCGGVDSRHETRTAGRFGGHTVRGLPRRTDHPFRRVL